MLTSIVLTVCFALNSPQDLTTANTGVLKGAGSNMILIAGSGRVAPGPIHGADPHNEQHDGGLPANQHAGDGYPSSDPYNDTTPNNRDSPNKPY